MKRFLIFLILFFSLFVRCTRAGDITAKLEIKEKGLKWFQPVAKAELPFPETGYVYVTDVNGLKVPSVRTIPGKNMRNCVYFKTNIQDIYYVHWLEEERKSETSVLEIPEGKVILDDFLNPSARTSGFWFWVSNPRLSGKFSHTGRGQPGINSHYTSIVPGQKVKPADIIYQAVFLDKNNVPEEIMIEIQTSRRKSYYFSWGIDKLKWKGINKIPMGNLPEKGRWSILAIPVEKMGKDIEITGIGFYNTGGRVYWDYTTIGKPALETEVIEWKKKAKKVSAYFEKEIFGPFSFSGNNFYVATFDASASSGAETFLWNIDEKKYSGRFIMEQFRENQTVCINLFCTNKRKESDVFSETVVFHKMEPEQVNLFLKIPPHRNLVMAGENFFIPVQAGSLMTGIVPVELVTDGNKEFLKLIPGKENACNKNLFFSPQKPEVHKIELKIGNYTIACKNMKFVPVDEISSKNIDGPYFVENDGTEIIGFVPDYKFSPVSTPADTKEITIIGDIPPDLIGMLKNSLPTEIGIVWHRYPESKTYHAIADVMWVKELFENKKTDTAIIFPALDALIHRTPVDEYIAHLDAILYLLGRKANEIICATPFPSAPLPEIFKVYADATTRLCMKRNILCLDIYSAYTSLPDWTGLFCIKPGVYGNYPTRNGLPMLTEMILKTIQTKNKEKGSVKK